MFESLGLSVPVVVGTAAVVGATTLFLLSNRSKGKKCVSETDLTGKTVIVTGGNTGTYRISMRCDTFPACADYYKNTNENLKSDPSLCSVLAVFHLYILVIYLVPTPNSVLNPNPF